MFLQDHTCSLLAIPLCRPITLVQVEPLMPLPRTCNLPQVTTLTCTPCSSIPHSLSLLSTFLPLSPSRRGRCLLLDPYQTSKEAIPASTTCPILAYVLCLANSDIVIDTWCRPLLRALVLPPTSCQTSSSDRSLSTGKISPLVPTASYPDVTPSRPRQHSNMMSTNGCSSLLVVTTSSPPQILPVLNPHSQSSC